MTPVVEDRRIPVTGGVTLAVRQTNPHGAGVPLLLVHGLASNARMWDGVADRLASYGHPVAAADLRGHGRSDKPDGGYDFATLSDDLMAVLAALGWTGRRPVAAGQSWGGNVVLEFAVRHPAATRAIAWVDGGTIEVSRYFRTFEQAEAALTPPRLAGRSAVEFQAMVRASHPSWPESGIAGLLANLEVRADGTVAPWLTLERHMTIVRHLWDHHPSQRYRLVPVPVLVVPTTIARADDVAEAQAALPRARVWAITGADHAVHAQHPVDVADLLHQATEASFFA